jgi:hypothetical protein
MIAMKAAPGDRIILRSRFLVRPMRDGRIVEIRGPAGEPPYLVQWATLARLMEPAPRPAA